MLPANERVVLFRFRTVLQVAGVLGALGAIPIAGSLQIVLADWRRHRPGANHDGAASTAVASEALQSR